LDNLAKENYFGFNHGTGFSFNDYTSFALSSFVGRAVNGFKQNEIWKKIQPKGMKQAFSWKNLQKNIKRFMSWLNKSEFSCIKTLI
jgi:glycogen synthase